MYFFLHFSAFFACKKQSHDDPLIERAVLIEPQLPL